MFDFKNCYKNHVVAITVTQLRLHLHLYKPNNYIFHDSLT